MPNNQMSAHHERGRILTLLESDMAHPLHGDGFVDVGEQVAVGQIVGVALLSAGAATDLIPMDTEGVYNLPVLGHDGTINAAIAIGDQVYLDPAADALLNVDVSATIPFGIALEPVTSGATTTIKVKITGTQ